LIPPPIVGLYGNQNQLQVDISRIPRFDELDTLLQIQNAPSGYSSDLRTVAYFLQQGQYVEASSMEATGLGGAETIRGGLMRRELDRATALFAADSGGAAVNQFASLLAPEVTWIEFNYFDGLEFWTEWDATDRGGLPVAVEVRIWLRPPTDGDEEAVTPSVGGAGPGQFDEMYKVVVHLPAAEPTSATDASGGTTGGTSSGGTSGGTNSGTGGSASGGATSGGQGGQ
jgi:hypothetical protein